jgi:predicted  nucleic acid-binding Zn-ribbon protein
MSPAKPIPAITSTGRSRAKNIKGSVMPEKIDIANQIDVLIKLQAIDTQIYRLNDEKAKKPQVITQLKDDFQKETLGLKQAEEAFTALQLKKKEKEIELKVKEDNIGKLQSQLYQIKTNKEYSAMQHEIEGQKADKSLMEDQILLLMEEIDKAKIQIAKEKQTLSEKETQLKEGERQVNLQLHQIENTLSELNVQRAAVIPDVDKDVLKKYERILYSKNGLALAEVVNHACQGCYMNLPPQVINEIRLKEKFIICENCTRFLYINDATG